VSANNTEDLTDDWRNIGATSQELQLITPGLQVAYHPDPHMVGARLRFLNFGDRAEVRVSRLEGSFRQRHWEQGRPLNVSRLSRSPLTFIPQGRDDVRLTFDPARCEVDLAGSTIQPDTVFTRRELADGLLLFVNRSVGLVLQLMGKPRAMDEDDYGLIGESLVLDELRRQLGLAMASRDAILLLGASGTGKELVARAIHQGGGDSEHPFIGVNMATIPSELAASELFGHEKGAFSGAKTAKVGLFRQARSGTLFLDEVGDASFAVQTALLRALETREVRPVGATGTLKVDCRFIAATDVDIHGSEEFKSALVSRLGIELALPPLLKRRDDIPILFHYFLEEALGSESYADLLVPGEKEPWLPAWVIDVLFRYAWPRNVRELRNVSREIAFLSGTRPFQPGPMLLRIRDAVHGSVGAGVESPEKKSTEGGRTYNPPSSVDEDTLRRVLREKSFGISAAARELGLSQQSMYRALDEHGILYARQLSREQFIAHFLEHDRNIRAMSEALEVSERALKLRKSDLGID